MPPADHCPDPYLALESSDNSDTHAWVDAQNARSLQAWGQGNQYETLLQKLATAYLPPDLPPVPTRHGEWAFDLLIDDMHPRGLWRRAGWEDWRHGMPRWQDLIDVDALDAQDGVPWQLADIEVIYPEYDRALITLSPGGGDACIVREFDIERGIWVEDGFAIEMPGKHSISWIDRDTVYVSWDHGEAMRTRAGYPREVRRWQRGVPIAEAPVTFRANIHDISVSAGYDPQAGRHLLWVCAASDLLRSYRLDEAGQWQRYDMAEHVEVTPWKDWLLLTPRKRWQAGDSEYAAGTLLAITEAAYLAGDHVAGDRAFTVLHTTPPRGSDCTISMTRNYLIVSWLDELHRHTAVWEPIYGADGSCSWHVREFPSQDDVELFLSPIDPMSDDGVYVVTESYLSPPATYLVDLARQDLSQLEPCMEFPPAFDAAPLAVRRRYARCRDGTMIPYSLIGPRSALAEDHPTPAPCVLTGYGGFSIPLCPEYDVRYGAGWLEQGGVVVIAHVRGGGEFGTAWHEAARGPHRQRAFDDFIAVAEDLIASGVTTSAQLGIEGGSNGGLMVAACMVQRPELFGAVVCAVPLLDMHRFHLLEAGAAWIDEYGDPEDVEAARVLDAYSPYHRVKADVSYPPVLFVTSSSDDLVHPGHARKMTARMQDEGHREVWLLEKAHGGHGSVDGHDAARQDALIFNFLWSHLARSRQDM